MEEYKVEEKFDKDLPVGTIFENKYGKFIVRECLTGKKRCNFCVYNGYAECLLMPYCYGLIREDRKEVYFERIEE